MPAARGVAVFVEIVRLLVVVMATATGHGLAGDDQLLGAIIGAGIGYVLGGLVGRLIVRLMGILERTTASYSAAELIVGGVGAAAVGGFGALFGVAAVAFLAPEIGWPLFGLITWIGAYGGFRVASRKARELLRVFGLSEQGLGGPTRFGDSPPTEDTFLLDTSILIDGRVLTVARTGFLRGDVIVPRFVLDELQGLADAQDPIRRRKGRRGLDVVEELAAARRVRLHCVEDDIPSATEVDAKLVGLARRMRVTLVTADEPLASLASLQGVSVVRLADVADAMHPAVLPGDRHVVTIVREGKEDGQGVAFLSDGSMVVVTDGQRHLGSETEVEIVSSTTTSVGRLHFAVVTPVESAPSR